MEHTISFPGLGLDLGTIRRVAFTIFGKPIMWYGIIIAFGFLLAALYATKRVKDFSIREDDLLDALICATPTAIICARLYYVIFNFSYYRGNPGSIIRIWDGGIAIYGAVIGAVAAVLIFCRVRRISPLPLLDIAALGLLIGQSIGRWGNFVNAEAFGSVTTLPWGMSINGAPPVHPTFFYESLWNAIGFVCLHFYSKKRRFRSKIFLLYVAWYGLGRFFIEGLRTDSLYLPYSTLRVSQLLAAISFVAAIALLFFLARRPAKTTVPAAENTETESIFCPGDENPDPEASPESQNEIIENGDIL